MLLLGIYSLLRVLFLCFNAAKYTAFSFQEILWALFHGIRFDIVAICLLNLPLLLFFFFLPNRNRRGMPWGGQLTHRVFCFINIPFIWINLVDFEYTKYSGKRMSLDILFVREGANQLGQFIGNYWYLGLLGLLFWGVLHFGARSWWRWRPLPYYTGGLVARGLWSVLVLAAVVVGIRGGLQKKVIKTMDAYALTNFDLGNLSLNSTFTLLTSSFILWRDGVDQGLRSRVEYFGSKQEVLEHIAPLPSHQSVATGQGAGGNVVLIILEGFSTEVWGVANEGEGYTPFLDSLATKGLFFKHHFSNGRNTIKSFFAILFSVPSFINTPLAISAYQHNQWQGLGHIFDDAGHYTSFFHGPKRDRCILIPLLPWRGLRIIIPWSGIPEGGSITMVLGEFLMGLSYNLWPRNWPLILNLFFLLCLPSIIIGPVWCQRNIGVNSPKGYCPAISR